MNVSLFYKLSFYWYSILDVFEVNEEEHILQDFNCYDLNNEKLVITSDWASYIYTSTINHL